jgi:hypothetical protein
MGSDAGEDELLQCAAHIDVRLLAHWTDDIRKEEGRVIQFACFHASLVIVKGLTDTKTLYGISTEFCILVHDSIVLT